VSKRLVAPKSIVICATPALTLSHSNLCQLLAGMTFQSKK